MRPSAFFHHCPRCGAKREAVPPAGPFVCAGCGFTFFFNAAIATAVFIERTDGRVLFIRRAKEPARGKLAPPGGFVDIGERVEEAIRREIREEVGLEISAPEFLCSFPNDYHYDGVTYPVLDLFFTARVPEAAQARALDDVESVCWFDPLEVRPDDLAFPSMRAAWECLRQS
jgi:ADP-ribose pyrophosphatase YjhB (NUDIX family)